jgi:predicted porin
MKKSILAIAVAATMAAPAVMAAPTVYGNIHLSLNAADNDVDGANNNLKVSSNTSAIGIKGSEDLGDGLKVIYKAEFELLMGPKPDLYPDTELGDDSDPYKSYVGGEAAAGAVGVLGGRDQFVGLKGGMGTIAFGTMSSNYKQMGGKIDPLYRTPLEGRGFLGTQSKLHGGKAINRGRSTHTAQYTSPSMGGISLVANTTFSGSEDETTGVGVRWSNKTITAYLDWIDGQNGEATAAGGNTESAMKIGGKFDADAFSVALQYEDMEDWVGRTYLFAAGTFNINDNNAVMLTYGQASDEVGDNDHDGMAIAYNHKMSKMTNVYVGYGAHGEDADNQDESMITAGLRKKF